jgi:2'-5' RNA ligase
MDPRPLIITAKLDDASQGYFDQLRERHFPPERNYLQAHLTMFHALPGTEIERAAALLLQIASEHASAAAEVSGLRSLGGGVAFTLRSPVLQTLRQTIASVFQDQLTPQDRQGWRPHITVQNKVDRERARDLLAHLQQQFKPWTASVQGLALWRYDGGPWEPAGVFLFGGAKNPSKAEE